MIRIRRQLEPLLEPGRRLTLWRIRETPDQRSERLSEAWGDHAVALMKRYKWLLNELHARLETIGLTVSAEQYCRDWWRIVENDLAGLSKTEDFSSYLWAAVATAASRLESDPEFAPVLTLKPKFMLRQFVDEMKDVASATSLRTLAYSPLTVKTGFATASNDEVADVVYQACLSLHATVKRFERSLAAMTGGAIALPASSDAATIARQYSAWLFRS